jgi:NitT/TauT family transport system permease protein
VLKTMVSDWSTYAPHVGVTVKETLAGLTLAVVGGVAIAFAIHISEVMSKLLYPPLLASQLVPTVAIAPLFVIWFGFGTFPKVLVAFLYAFFPVVLSGVTGFESIDTTRIHLARCTGASRWRVFRKVRLPGALPHIFGGIKVASAFAVIGAVLGEFLGASEGLGYLLVTAGNTLDTLTAFSALGYLTAIGVSLWVAVGALERLAMPWKFEMAKRGRVA